MPPTDDDATVGVQVLAGLPDGNGLPSVAADVLDDPKPVYCLVELRPRKEVHNVDTDSHTVVLRIAQIEPVTGAEAKALREQLDVVRERRTGQRPLIDGDGTPAVDAVLDDEQDGGTVPAEPTPTDTAGSAPAFTPPTPIKGTRAKAGAGG